MITIGMITLPMEEAPMVQKIAASRTTGISYVLDGVKILEGATTLQYEDRNYISVADFARALGKEVAYEDGQIIRTTKEVKEAIATLPVEEEEAMSEEELRALDERLAQGVEIERAIIKEVDTEGKYITVLPAGLEDNVGQYVVIVLQDNTIIKGLDHVEGTINDLKVGAEVHIIHSPMMTRSDRKSVV